MRKAQQQDILNIIAAMEQAHEKIRHALEKKALEPAKQMLVGCQKCAIDLGNAIEQIEGEGFVSISYLERYCDIVYRLYEETDAGSNPAKVAKKLKKALLQVENSVKNDVKIRKEVVFFPYKASMWDSLESVYLAAREDEDCDAYCVPIPYYDRRTDGSFGQMHYEGNLYPKNIVITDYRTYNLEERHPDVIYIHNPYDGLNHVTSVPERYYARNLCRHTDKLVYIPYFILGEINADDPKDVDTMKHFCFQPGVVYANKVIVQSENMRQIYITEYIKAAKKCGFAGEHIDREFQQQKILGLGSPKVDKVLNTRKEDLEIPKEWLNIIKKPDGTWKKIVFYNTGVSALLWHDEKMIRKMESVFEFFKENQDEVALLWRPHPLIRATIESMRPKLWTEYMEQVEKYREEAWGIYDDTADMDRAMVLSDAYYGDGSSIVPLFRKLGKSDITQNVMYKNSINAIAVTEAITYVDNEYWFVPYWGDGLYKMNDAFGIQKVGSFNENGRRALFAGVVSYENELVFVPELADMISVYDRKTGRMYQIDFQGNVDLSCPIKGGKFASWVVLDDYLYLIPSNYHSLVSVDMRTKETKQYCIYDGGNRPISIGNAAALDGNIYFACKEEGCILKFNVGLKTIDKILPGDEKRVYTHLFCVNQKLWLIPFDVQEGIRVWNAYTDEFEEILAVPQEAVVRLKESELEKFPERIATEIRNGDTYYFSLGILHGQKIYLFTRFYGKNIIIHTAEKKIDFWDADQDCFEEIMFTWMRSMKWFSYVQKKDDLYVISGVSGEWYQCEENVWRKVEKNSMSGKEENQCLLIDRQELIFKKTGEFQKLEKFEKIGQKIYLE